MVERDVAAHGRQLEAALVAGVDGGHAPDGLEDLVRRSLALRKRAQVRRRLAQPPAQPGPRSAQTEGGRGTRSKHRAGLQQAVGADPAQEVATGRKSRAKAGSQLELQMRAREGL